MKLPQWCFSTLQNGFILNHVKISFIIQFNRIIPPATTYQSCQIFENIQCCHKKFVMTSVLVRELPYMLGHWKKMAIEINKRQQGIFMKIYNNVQNNFIPRQFPHCVVKLFEIFITSFHLTSILVKVIEFNSV